MPVKIRRLLRHHKRLAAHTVCIDMYQIRMSIQPVYPTAAEYQPPTVTAPGMITFYIPTVGSCHRNTFPGMQIHQVQIGILVPDREITIRGSRKHQKSAIRRYPRERNTLFQIIGLKQSIHLIPELPIFRVEADGTQVIPYLFKLGRHRPGRCRTEIKDFPIGRESRESFESPGIR